MTSSSNSSDRALLVLTGINLFNYIDRYILPPILSSVQRDLGLTDTAGGLLATGFLLVYMLVSPVFGALGDRGGRTRLLALGVTIWSIATALGGLAVGFISLLLSRALVGVGEAAYGTIAPAMLSDLFPPSRRGRILAIFYTAIPVGGAMGFIIGGLMNAHFGWRSAFFVAGIPGLLLAWMTLRLPDPPPGQGARDPGEEAPDPVARESASWRSYSTLLGNSRYAVAVLGYTAYTFALGALGFWMPAFLERVRGLPPATASSSFGAILVVTGLLGTFAGGWVGDRLLKRTEHSYLLVSGVATLLAAPLTWIALTVTDQRLYFPALIVGEILIFACTGPINSAILNYVQPTHRASAMALSILLIHLLGDVPSPVLVGNISDRLSLQEGMLIIPVAVFLSGVIWLTAALFWSRPPRQPA